MVAKARQLQRDGDLRGREAARYEVEHQTTVAQLAGGLETLTSIYKQSGRFAEALKTGLRYRQVLGTIPMPTSRNARTSSCCSGKSWPAWASFPTRSATSTSAEDSRGLADD